jgi:hypothetical protein
MSEPTFRRGKHLFGREAELRKQILRLYRRRRLVFRRPTPPLYRDRELTIRRRGRHLASI